MSDGTSDLMELARHVVRRTRELGAEEVSVSASRGTHVSIQRREGKVEHASEATTRGLVVSLLANDRYTSNATSDLRPEALDAFLQRCVASARFLEPDPNRRLADPALCGRGVSEEALDQDDPAWATRTAADRDEQCAGMERALLAVEEARRLEATLVAGAGADHGRVVVGRGDREAPGGSVLARDQLGA